MQLNPSQAMIDAAAPQFARIGREDAESRLRDAVGKVRAVTDAYTANGSSFEGLTAVDGSDAATKRENFAKQQAEVCAIRNRVAEIKAMAAIGDEHEAQENDAHASEILNRGGGSEPRAERTPVPLSYTQASRQAANALMSAVATAASYTGEPGGFFRSVAEAGKAGVAINGDASGLFHEPLNVISNTAGFSIYPPMSDRVVDVPRPQVSVLDIIARENTESNAYKYRRQTVAGGEQLEDKNANAAGARARGWKAEGAASTTDANYVWEEATAIIETIMGTTEITWEQMMDAAGIDTRVLGQLRLDLRRNLELMLLHGQGENNEPQGLIEGTAGTDFSTVAHSAPSSGETNYGFDFLAQAMYDQIFVNTQLMPNYILLHPVDWRKLSTTRDANGNLQFMDPQDVAMQRVLGLPVILSQYTKLDRTAGTAVIGNFTEACAMLDRQQLVVDSTESHGTNFKASVTTFRARGRFGTGKWYPLGVATVTGFDGSKTT